MGCDLISVREATGILPVSVDKIYRMLRSGELKGRRVGRRWLVYRSLLLAYVEQGKQEKPRPPVTTSPRRATPARKFFGASEILLPVPAELQQAVA